MTRAIALKLQSHAALAAVVRPGGESIVVEAAVRIPLAEGDDAKARGQAIAAALASLRPGRAPTVVVVPRAELSWQNYDLPPAPADDLPDLVHMQVQRDLPLAEDGEGFDFLPLSGDEEHPHRVLGVGVLPGQLQRIREMCEAAELKLERIVPEPLGWPELGRRLATASEGAGGLTVFAAMADRQATVWASDGDALRMIRTIWLTEDHDQSTDVTALGGELRRTLLSLTNSHGGDRAAIKCVYCGLHADDVAGQLSTILSRPVRALSLERIVTMPVAGDAATSLVELTPLAALAAATADRNKPLMDLLHPRRRPAPPSRMRTHVLAAAAAIALVGLMAWYGYRTIRSPLEAAATADAERLELAPVLEDLAEDERKAAAVRTWLDASANLLTEFDQLGQQLRPEPLESDKFKADQDMVLTKFTMSNRELTLDAAAKSNDALSPAEGRLRGADYRVDRGPVDFNAKAVPGYGVGVVVTVERADEASAAEGPL